MINHDSFVCHAVPVTVLIVSLPRLAPLTLSRTLMAEAMPTMPTPTTVTLFLQPTGSSFMTWLISFSLVDICVNRNRQKWVRA